MNEITDETETTLASLHERLEREAADRGLVDVAYRVVDSPVGRLLVAATEHGIVRVAFESEGFDTVLETLADRVSPRVLEAPGRLDRAAAELDEYFAGHRTSFDLPLDFALSRGFRGEVQRLLPSIAYGHTTSYARLADAAGRPRAFRAVGTACATNPLPVVVPCHRVLRGDGSLGGYVGGLDAKRALLSLEAAA
ncbi:methylated-DNA--[protein]-cysteine S-methyltransferase [Humibacter sp.]|jgi:methylated-DNA-[protein]-cysteine S-methyltransferase|uniref:methylated-DNA--[protein]-cysteine S-methyltransferase n=1 Tax=Humibacter sp. TaxID=1940291 RepID=UPI002C76644C|nr:methylated-DNA--[protein]-cysteine S-methyltransferase [Humibacter sp.]HVX08596.1 methylated-DNA--[protein]-cysteine S-methyltransferase [Humibacter sp.]